jgi:putative glutathione S-transferase
MRSLDAWIYADISNGVYKCGFATSQLAYDFAIERLFSALEKLELLLSDNRNYLAGGQLTLTDISLFVALVRFDEVYVGLFKCDRKKLVEFP